MTTITHAADAHPMWCERLGHCSHNDTERRTREHVGRESSVYAAGDDVRMSLRLYLSEDVHPHTGEDHAQAKAWLRLVSTALGGTDGGPVAFDAYLDADDLDTLARLASQYAALLRHRLTVSMWVASDELDPVAR